MPTHKKRDCIEIDDIWVGTSHRNYIYLGKLDTKSQIIIGSLCDENQALKEELSRIKKEINQTEKEPTEEEGTIPTDEKPPD
jgi:hypothetical protein